MTNELKKAIEIVKSYLDMDSDVDSEYLNAQRTIINALEAPPTEVINKIPEDYVYDTETDEFEVYRHKYTGKEIHITKEPKLYKIEAQPTDAVSRQDVDAYIAKLMSGYLYDEERTRLEEFSAYLWELPPVTPRTNLAKTSQDCISRLNRIMEYTYGMLTAEKFGLQHLIKSMMDELSGGGEDEDSD